MRELPRAPLSGWQLVLARVIGTLAGAALLVVGFFFSLFVLGALLLAGSVLAAWWWWRTRDLRQALREQRARWPQDGQADFDIVEGEIIEGEIIREEDSTPRLPR